MLNARKYFSHEASTTNFPGVRSEWSASPTSRMELICTGYSNSYAIQFSPAADNPFETQILSMLLSNALLGKYPVGNKCINIDLKGNVNFPKNMQCSVLIYLFHLISVWLCINTDSCAIEYVAFYFL